MQICCTFLIFAYLILITWLCPTTACSWIASRENVRRILRTIISNQYQQQPCQDSTIKYKSPRHALSSQRSFLWAKSRPVRVYIVCIYIRDSVPCFFYTFNCGVLYTALTLISYLSTVLVQSKKPLLRSLPLSPVIYSSVGVNPWYCMLTSHTGVLLIDFVIFFQTILQV